MKAPDQLKHGRLILVMQYAGHDGDAMYRALVLRGLLPPGFLASSL